jgi:hypothetical protein
MTRQLRRTKSRRRASGVGLWHRWAVMYITALDQLVAMSRAEISTDRYVMLLTTPAEPNVYTKKTLGAKSNFTWGLA